MNSTHVKLTWKPPQRLNPLVILQYKIICCLNRKCCIEFQMNNNTYIEVPIIYIHEVTVTAIALGPNESTFTGLPLTRSFLIPL